MTEPNEPVEFVVPSGVLVVRQARCPKGCDLMAPGRLIHGQPSICVRFVYEEQDGFLYLDPIYGRHENISEIQIPDGAVVDFFCSGCNTPLHAVDSTCSDCSAPMFMLHLPKEGFVEGCQRNGCRNHRLRMVSSGELLQRAFDELGEDSFL
jgi:hypothetical protein